MSRGIVASQRVPGRDSRSVLLIGGLQVYAHITLEKSPELWVKDLTRLGKISIPETEGLWETNGQRGARGAPYAKSLFARINEDMHIRDGWHCYPVL